MVWLFRLGFGFVFLALAVLVVISILMLPVTMSDREFAFSAMWSAGLYLIGVAIGIMTGVDCCRDYLKRSEPPAERKSP